MRAVRFLIPGDLTTPSGGYRYDRRLIDGLRSAGWPVEYRRLDASFPRPTAAALADAARCLAAIPDGTRVLVDGLAFGRMAEAAAAHASRLRLVALVHHPLALETGLSIDEAQAFRRDEVAALGSARRILTTSDTTARCLIQDYGVDPARIRVAEPGTDPAPPAVGSGTSARNLLCVASVTPRKGHDILLTALAELTDLPWHLDCVGSLHADPGTAQRLADQALRSGLGERVRFRGALDDPCLAEHYHRADLFVLPTRYEGYGMVLTEALARGLPIVGTRVGPVPGIVPPAAGLLVPANDPAALRDALRRVLSDRALHARLGAGARVARAHLRAWQDTVRDCARVLEEVGDESL